MKWAMLQGFVANHALASPPPAAWAQLQDVAADADVWMTRGETSERGGTVTHRQEVRVVLNRRAL